MQTEMDFINSQTRSISVSAIVSSGTQYPAPAYRTAGTRQSSISSYYDVRTAQVCRSASIGSRRLARKAGYQPKNTPTMPENTTASTTDCGSISSGQPAALDTANAT